MLEIFFFSFKTFFEGNPLLVELVEFRRGNNLSSATKLKQRTNRKSYLSP